MPILLSVVLAWADLTGPSALAVGAWSPSCWPGGSGIWRALRVRGGGNQN